MSRSPSNTQAVYALVGRTFACDAYEPLYQRSLAERASRHALGRGSRRSDGRRWHVSDESPVLPAGLPA